MTRKTTFLVWWSWFKFNNLGLAIGTKLKFYSSLSKGLNLKVRKFSGLTLTFVEVTGEKVVGLLSEDIKFPRKQYNSVEKKNYKHNQMNKSCTLSNVCSALFWFSSFEFFPRHFNKFYLYFCSNSFWFVVIRNYNVRKLKLSWKLFMIFSDITSIKLRALS